MNKCFLIHLSFILGVSLTQGAQTYPPKIKSDSVHIYKSVDGYDLNIWIFNSASNSEKRPQRCSSFLVADGIAVPLNNL